MRIVLQRVTNASVQVDKKVIGSIAHGFLILLGVGQGDTTLNADSLIDKMLKLRVFEDKEHKMNKSIVDVNGSVLVVSQFTLYADCKKGNRPSFMEAAPPDEAREMYVYVVKKLQEKDMHVETGEFGAYMQVSLVNDGPVTIILEN